jgi:ribosomal protein L16 Arg81 hydroxylase
MAIDLSSGKHKLLIKGDTAVIYEEDEGVVHMVQGKIINRAEKGNWVVAEFPFKSEDWKGEENAE